MFETSQALSPLEIPEEFSTQLRSKEEDGETDTAWWEAPTLPRGKQLKIEYENLIR